MDPKDEKKPEGTPQAPAQEPPKVEAGTPKVEPKVEAKPGPEGLDAFTSDQLKAFYNRSPQMFVDAGIVPPKEEKKAEPPPKKDEPPPAPAVSAAPKPKYGEVEIVLPEDVPVNRAVVDAYLAHAKEIGLDAKQVQGEIDYQTRVAREAMKLQPVTPKAPTPAEIDAENVVKLKADAEFGAKFEDNMNIARRAAMKFGDKEVLAKLVTSDPVLVKHFWKIGLADSEDVTLRAPNRNGEETTNEEEAQQSHLKSRYNHPSSQSMFK